jgi:hypothetical protein
MPLKCMAVMLLCFMGMSEQQSVDRLVLIRSMDLMQGLPSL